ncbi:MAG: hypothetical protein ACYTXA_13510 [Nostoc sp.]
MPLQPMHLLQRFFKMVLAIAWVELRLRKLTKIQKNLKAMHSQSL